MNISNSKSSTDNSEQFTSTETFWENFETYNKQNQPPPKIKTEEKNWIQNWNTPNKWTENQKNRQHRTLKLKIPYESEFKKIK